MAAKLMSGAKVHDDWQDFVDNAEEYVKDFSYDGAVYTCESAHYAAGEPPEEEEEGGEGVEGEDSGTETHENTTTALEESKPGHDESGNGAETTTEETTPEDGETTADDKKDEDAEEEEEEDAFKPLVFSSIHNEEAFGVEEGEVDEETGGVAMGLDKTSVKGEVGWDELLGKFSVPKKPSTNSLQKLFDLLKQLKILEIDVDRQGNGFWILPKVEVPEEEEEEEEKEPVVDEGEGEAAGGEVEGGDAPNPNGASGGGSVPNGGGLTPKSDGGGKGRIPPVPPPRRGPVVRKPAPVTPIVPSNGNKPPATAGSNATINEPTPETKPEEEAEEKPEPEPVLTLDVATRLAYKIKATLDPDAAEFLEDLKNDFPGLKKLSVDKLPIGDIAIILTDIITYGADEDEPKIVSTITFCFLKLRDLVFYISQTDGETTLALRQQSKEKPIPPSDPTEEEDPAEAEDQVRDLDNAMDAPKPTEAVPGDNFHSIRLWYADFNTSTKKWIIAFIMDLPLTKNKDGVIPIYLKYDKGSGKFSGGMLRGELPEESNLALPAFREYHALPEDILAANKDSPGIELQDTFNFKAPKGLPTFLTKANITYTQARDKTPTTEPTESEITLEVALETGEPQEADALSPPAPFNWDKVSFSLNKKGKNQPSWKFRSEFLLKEQVVGDAEPREDGKLSLEIKKSPSGGLQMTGEAADLNFAMLGSFFDPDLSETMVSILGKIEISKLYLDYNYNPKGKASDFLFSGVILIGKLQLDLFYQYASSTANATKKEIDESTAARETQLKSRRRDVPAPPAEGPTPLGPRARPRRGPPPPPPVAVGVKEVAWQFDAYLSAASPGESLGSIIASIIGEDPLPDFISNISVPTVGVDEESGKPLIALKVAKLEDKVVFIFSVNVATIQFSFIQIGNKKLPGQLVVVPPIRILRLSIGPLPFIKDIPVVNELPQPYQFLTFCYVGGPVGLRGVEKLYVDMINEKYISDNKIFYKKVTQPQTYALLVGNHFIVINNDECVLDHIFGTGQAKKKPGAKPQGAITGGNNPPVTEKPAAEDTTAKNDTAVEPTNPPAKGTLQKKSKFLTITGISVQYKNKTLWLFINATLAMGPVELSLIGFGIGLKLGGEGLRLNDIAGTFDMKDLAFQINGVAINFDRPPVLIAGVFIHEVTEKIDSYRGGIAVGFKPYEFVAVGEYAEVTENKQKYKSIFLYAKLDGPLIDLQIAIIKGVRLGFGYNSFVRMPNVNELAEFPFINDSGISGAGNNPMKILEGMRGGPNPWVAPKLDSYWFALGFSISAFNLLTATAVALLGFSDEGVVVSIFADVVCMVPPAAPAREMCIVYVELLMNAELNFIHDYFFVQAALAPTSFFLVPQCQLYGGFAMGVWFGRSQYAGDWVFTVGGYHRAFKRPSHYPDPSRLGIKFNIGDNISIRGEGYFAITPKCVMGGSMTKIQINVGPVNAHLTTAWDAVLQFNPLHYVLDMYVEIGVSCRIHLLFISFDISISIGADLHIEGPGFGGVAHVDFWFFGFDIYFGEQPGPPPPLTLAQFYDVVAKAGPPETPSKESKKNSKDTISGDFITQLKFSLEEGAAPAPVEDTTGSDPPNAGSGSTWRVKGGDFKFRVSSVFAISSASIETASSVVAEKTKTPAEEKALELAIVNDDPKDVVKISSIPMQVKRGNITSSLYIKITDENVDATKINELYPSDWQPEFVVKQVPTALWGDPEHPPDPLTAEDGCVPLNMAVSITAPLPTLAVSKIGPLNATDIMRLKVMERPLKDTETQVGMAAALLDEKPGPRPWDTMQVTWETSVAENQATANALVDGCMETLGWNFPAPEVMAKVLEKEKKEGKKMERKPWELVSRLPERLVSGNLIKVDEVKDGLHNFYLALPRVCVA